MTDESEIEAEVFEPEVLPAVTSPQKKQDATPFHGDIGLLTPEMIVKAKAAIDGVKQVKEIALTATNYSDWVSLGKGSQKKAYLSESGCKKLANLWGISFHAPTCEDRERKVGDKLVREFTTTIEAEFHGRVVTEVGTCNSEYDFYKYRKDEKGNRYELPYAERNFANMRKHSQTNAYARALKAILGIGTIPWEDVERIMGRDSMQKTAAVTYDKGGTAPERPAQTVASVESGDRREKLWKMCLELNDGDPELAGNYLERKTSFVSQKDGKTVKGFRDPKNPKISDGWIGKTYAEVKKDWEPTFGGPPEAA